MVGTSTKPLVRVLTGEVPSTPPWWLMRQAGRYLPEYREVRSRSADFIELCLTPTLATELTLQPIRRFGMDAAILFSDILLLPYALGQRVDYREGEGPVLDAITEHRDLSRLNMSAAASTLEPVLETLRRVRTALGPKTALIGFAGAPWTVAAYMVEGGASRDFRRVKGWAYRDPHGFGALIDLLIEATIQFLGAQITAGAETVQLFDTWAGVLAEAEFRRWVVEPTKTIVTQLKRRHPECPIIGFPRGAGPLYECYVDETAVDAIGIDTAVPKGFARERLALRVAVQGNLDPVLLLTGGTALERAVRELRLSFAGSRWIFNLGHGVLTETPPEHVAALSRLLKGSAGPV
jgi:uroporphyrinogen decarboxylase